MTNFSLKTLLTFCIALVWLVNGFFCKVLNFVPRHQLIVAQFMGEEHAFLATKAIGALEILMVIWIFSRIRPRWCAVTQIVTVGLMNILEFLLVPDLLLFGRANLLLAALFMLTVYFTEFILARQPLVSSRPNPEIL